MPPGKGAQACQVQALQRSVQGGIRLKLKHDIFAAVVEHARLAHAHRAGRGFGGLASVGAQNALGHTALTDEIDHRNTLQTQGPARQHAKGGVQAHPGKARAGVKENYRRLCWLRGARRHQLSYTASALVTNLVRAGYCQTSARAFNKRIGCHTY